MKRYQKVVLVIVVILALTLSYVALHFSNRGILPGTTLTYERERCGPYAWGSTMKTWPDGFVRLDIRYDVKGFKMTILAKPQQDEINNLVQKARFYNLNRTYPEVGADICRITLTIRNSTSVKSVSWTEGKEAQEYKPKALFELESYLGNIRMNLMNSPVGYTSP